MKLFFSLFILISLNSYAENPLVLITYEGGDRSFMKQVEKIMQERFNIAKDLYTIEQGDCIPKKSIATHICINQNQVIKTIYRNNEVMEEMLGIYWK